MLLKQQLLSSLAWQARFSLFPGPCEKATPGWMPEKRTPTTLDVLAPSRESCSYLG